MNKFILIIIVLYLLLSPFYFFESGMPQPADIIVSFGIIIFVLAGYLRKVSKDIVVIFFFRFLLLVALINSIYFLYYSNEGIDNIMYMAVLFYIFNFFFFIVLLFILKFSNFSKTVNYLSFFIILALGLQFVLALFGIQGGAKDEVGARQTLFFNNPNQLGYYALLMLSLFAILPSVYRKNKFTMTLTIVFSACLILYSGSRAAMAGVLILGVIMLYKEGFKFKLKSIFLVVAASFSIFFLWGTKFVQEKISFMEVRGERNENTNISEAQIRGYDRFWIHPEYVFYGAGEGRYDRFNSYHELEMHSGFGTVLFSYGILGMILFIIIIFKAIEKDKLFNFMLLLPVLIYNVTHQGFRHPLFWALLAAIYIVTQKENLKIKYEQT
jgi:hypothetical protein